MFSVGFYSSILNQLNIIGDNDIDYDSESDEDYTIDEIVIIVLLHIIMKSKLQYLKIFFLMKSLVQSKLVLFCQLYSQIDDSTF